MLLTDEQRSALDDVGYVVLEDAIDSETVERLREILAEWAAPEIAQGIRPGRVLFLQKLAERDERLRAFATSPSFVELSTPLLGPDVDLYFNQAVIKFPGGNTAFSWHQDDAYSPVEPSPYLTVWIALDDATEANGCISVLPGSHRRGLVPHVESDFGLAGHSLDDPDQGIPVPVAAGTSIVFWSTTLHKSGPNTSDAVRRALVLQYAPTGLRHKASGMPIRVRIQVARDGVATGVPGRR